MSEILNYAATCLFGLEKFVGEEIDALGYKRQETIDGRVYFCGDETAVARFNLWSRYSERLYIVMGNFNVESFSDLFDGVKSLPWEKFISAKDAFPVKGHSVKSVLTSIPDCQSIVKKAIVERLKSKYGLSWFEETGTKYQIDFFILNNKATLMIDTSGAPLHKRGYRTESGEAPIRETLACALVKLSRPREDVRLWDPFCGSGTIPIEASLMMKNIAPGIKRAFEAEKYPYFDKALFSSARAEAQDVINNSCSFLSFGTDTDSKVLDIAKANSRRAGVYDCIRFFEKDALKITKDDIRTTIVCNPPYGERLNTVNQARKLYIDMGKRFERLSPWQIYVITSEEEFEKYYGRRADKVRKLYNGMIKCWYYQFFKNFDAK